VRRADADLWRRWRDDRARTTYAFDVRTRAEFEGGHPDGFRHAPGGQLVQETDVFAPVRGARIVLWDAGTVRADMTASWLAQMGWDVHVLDDIDGVPDARGPESRRRVPAPVCLEINAQEARLLLGDEDAVAVDVSPSRDYLAGHVDGAWLVSRTRLAESVSRLPPAGTYVVISTDGFLAAHAAADLRAASGVRTLVLTGGTAAWRDSGLPLSPGPERLTIAPADVYKRPYEGTDNARSAMQSYLDWEFGLVEQLARDGTHGFTVVEL
jgi:rhodanese-related sulfurtransferase